MVTELAAERGGGLGRVPQSRVDGEGSVFTAWAVDGNGCFEPIVGVDGSPAADPDVVGESRSAVADGGRGWALCDGVAAAAQTAAGVPRDAGKPVHGVYDGQPGDVRHLGIEA